MTAPQTPTSVLRSEHALILEVLDVLDGLLRTPDAAQWDFASIERCVTFFRLFADACHHGKEEDVLFPELEARGIPRDGGPIGVMLYEHQQGRAFVRIMAQALPDAMAGDAQAQARLLDAGRGYIALLRQPLHDGRSRRRSSRMPAALWRLRPGLRKQI